MDVRERARILMRVVEELKERQEELARLESADAGGDDPQDLDDGHPGAS